MSLRFSGPLPPSEWLSIYPKGMAPTRDKLAVLSPDIIPMIFNNSPILPKNVHKMETHR